MQGSNGRTAQLRAELREAQNLAERCRRFLAPLLEAVDARADSRLVRTLAASVPALIRQRDPAHALLLSELGGVLLGPRQAPAGTKRLSNLLHSPRWSADLLDQFHVQQAQQIAEQEAARVPERRALCILDGSVLEKPESTTRSEGLCPVRSSRARRLARPRPRLGLGYFSGPPSGQPIVVPGHEWQAALVTGWAGPEEQRPVALGAWYWYAKPEPGATPGLAADSAWAAQAREAAAIPLSIPRQRLREAQRSALEPLVAACGPDRLLHVWDRGLSGAGWLGEVLDQGWHFVVRWKKKNYLRPADAPTVRVEVARSLPTHRLREAKEAWRLTSGQKAWGRGTLANSRHPDRPVGVAFGARPVYLVHRDEPLWLVWARLTDKRGRRSSSTEPWRLLTTEPVRSVQECWRIVQAYAARWRIEEQLRFGKSELGLQSVRVRHWDARRKLLGLVSLAYAFLVDLLGTGPPGCLDQLMRWAHRTGERARRAWRPLYRLRLALAALWNTHTPSPQVLRT